MGLTDSIFGRSTVSLGSQASQAAGTGSNGAGLATANNNAIQVINGNQVDTAFLDALYTGGKLTAVARDTILAGGDPSIYGLIPYDLYVLTCGRLGYRNASTSVTVPVVPLFSSTTTYQAGQMVLFPVPGGQALYQAQQAVPAGTTPPAAGYWVQLAGPQSMASIAMYSGTTAYAPGQLVIYQQPGTQTFAIYLCQVQTVAGVLPTVTANWLAVTNPGPVVLFDADVTNPALATIATPASGVLGLQSTSGTALGPITIPAGRRYRIQTFNPRPAAALTSMPTDSNIQVFALAAESAIGDSTGNVVLTITPRWTQTATANTAGVAAVAAGLLTARVRVELL